MTISEYLRQITVRQKQINHNEQKIELEMEIDNSKTEEQPAMNENLIKLRELTDKLPVLADKEQIIQQLKNELATLNKGTIQYVYINYEIKRLEETNTEQ